MAKSDIKKGKPYEMEVGEIYVEPKIKEWEEIKEIDRERKENKK